MFHLKFHKVVFLLALMMSGGTTLAHAQGLDVFFGVGTATDSSNKQLINTFGDGTLFPTPKLTGTFGTIGGDYMFKPQLGFGAETSFRFSQGSYAGLSYRPSFYDFNAIFIPAPKASRIVPEFQGGLGAAKLSFYYSQRFCDVFAGCSTSNLFLESSHHFQLHASAAVRIYVKGGMFIRPAVDAHWVHNLYQFGSNWVPAYNIGLGYTFGR